MRVVMMVKSEVREPCPLPQRVALTVGGQFPVFRIRLEGKQEVYHLDFLPSLSAWCYPILEVLLMKQQTGLHGRSATSGS
jgi:hypothetical protein